MCPHLHTHTLAEIRAIILQTNLPSILDACNAQYLHDIVCHIYSRIDGVLHTGVPHTQIIDMSHSLSTEKEVELRGHGALCKADFR